jgi:hypothetical protein
MKTADIIAQLIAVEKAVARHEAGLIHSTQMRAEEEIPDPERLMIEVSPKDALLRQRLENCNRQFTMVWPQAPARCKVERRANAS